MSAPAETCSHPSKGEMRDEKGRILVYCKVCGLALYYGR